MLRPSFQDLRQRKPMYLNREEAPAAYGGRHVTESGGVVHVTAMA
jgi:hypothetical protein